MACLRPFSCHSRIEGEESRYLLQESHGGADLLELLIFSLLLLFCGLTVLVQQKCLVPQSVPRVVCTALLQDPSFCPLSFPLSRPCQVSRAPCLQIPPTSYPTCMQQACGAAWGLDSSARGLLLDGRCWSAYIYNLTPSSRGLSSSRPHSAGGLFLFPGPYLHHIFRASVSAIPLTQSRPCVQTNGAHSQLYAGRRCRRLLP
jgi:hypothetical protein